MPYDEEPLPPNNTGDVDEWIEQALRGRWPLSDDQPDPWLIQELHDYYAEQAQTINDRLGRVWQRFEQRAEMQPQRRRQTRQSDRPPFPQERRQPLQKPESLVFASWHWPERFSLLTAVVLLVVLVGGLLAGLLLFWHNGTDQPSPVTRTPTGKPISTIQPSATPIIQTNLLFSDLRMTSATTGWTVATPANATWGNLEAYKVLHTSNGGRLWNDVTPPFVYKPTPVDHALPVLPLFLNDSTAWMLNLPNIIFETVDSGHTWQAITTPAEVAQYSFIDTNDGWVLGTDGGVYQTADAGKNWTKLQSMGQGNLPYNANVYGLTFLNANDGWMTGITNQTDYPWVYVTHNGGKTWRHESIFLPPGTYDAPLLVTSPVFVSNQDGFLWINYAGRFLLQNKAGVPQSGSQGLELYVTHNGGATWQDMSVVPGNLGALAFSDGSHGWISGGWDKTTSLWATSDGAQHWSQIATSPNFMSIGQLDFVSETTGWALSSPSGVQSQLLLKTVDGGHTWTAIDYSVSG